MSSLLRTYLSDRLGLLLACYAGAGLLLLLLALLQPGLFSWADVAYGGLLITTALVIGLALDFLRWRPVARGVRDWLTDADAAPEPLLTLPHGGTAEQEEWRQAVQRLYAWSAAERSRYQENYQRHLTFINLWVHQMKSPVSAISLIAQRAEAREPAELVAAMESIDEETGSLADGLEMVLNVARLQDFAQDYRIEPVDLPNLVRQVINSRKRQFVRLRIYPEVRAPEGGCAVLTDAKWSRFVLEQIVANALKYGAAGGLEGQWLRISIARHEDQVQLSVADEGPGIPPEDLPRVFEPFFTGKNGRRYADATGIGLFLVRQVTERLGHQVAIASRVGQGTVVTLTFTASKLTQV